MDSRSWWTPPPDPPEHRLPEDLRQRDPLGARDCGWVSQMRPFVRQFSAPGGCVLDPFCGFGSTLLAAELEGRRGLGLEIDAARAGLARERLQRLGLHAQVRVGALPQLALEAPVDLCLTNVPYFGCDWPGAATPGQLYASTDYAAYLHGLRAVFHAVRRGLRDDGFCIAMVENVEIGGVCVAQAWDLARLLGSLFVPCAERVLCYPRDSAQALAPGDARSDRSHEYALIFQKRREPIDLPGTAHLLAALLEDGFDYALYGSYPDWLADPAAAARLPGDVDLLLPRDPGQLQRLLDWLRARGFALSLWGEPLASPPTLAVLDAHHYLRAERRDRGGGLLRVDLSLQPAADALTAG
ncbi:DNA methyltransferase [Xanthomonas sp. NCPPB 2654]|uniref:DNA methyltransferase n=1 Tax=unclassified Xanthomonas TaxID=2643310 RepID=UPI0021E08655|nr:MULTISPECIES: DNA methyltransferase [unclassified Xanthomonas]MDL5367149.1 DNA methyltransferase [Xanthomonas sp. NCPPB 2654]UYC20003.1 DNA methyltransferase [Xanthomonas sp. CFBP 8443]